MKEDIDEMIAKWQGRRNAKIAAGRLIEANLIFDFIEDLDKLHSFEILKPDSDKTNFGDLEFELAIDTEQAESKLDELEKQIDRINKKLKRLGGRDDQR